MTIYTKKGFIRIEVLIFIIVLVLVATVMLSAFLSAKVEARDKRRLTDISQIQKVLTIYFDQNGFYPNNGSNETPVGIDSYLDSWPSAPAADGSCTGVQNNYSYSQKSNGNEYYLTFCLGQGAGSLRAGPHTASSQGIQ